MVRKFLIKVFSGKTNNFEIALFNSETCHPTLKLLANSVLVKVKQSRYRPGVAQRVPGS